MSRCWGCCQENCQDCSCDCHDDEKELQATYKRGYEKGRRESREQILGLRAENERLLASRKTACSVCTCELELEPELVEFVCESCKFNSDDHVLVDLDEFEAAADLAVRAVSPYDLSAVRRGRGRG
jgi:hypothetical protein